MITRMTITLNPSDMLALKELAQQEYRDARTQGSYLIREALLRRGLVPEPTTPQPTPSARIDPQPRRGIPNTPNAPSNAPEPQRGPDPSAALTPARPRP